MAEATDLDASTRRRRRLFFLIAGLAVLATIVGVGLLMNIFERKQEARNPFYRVVELTDDTEDPAVWGKNFPLQYDDYKGRSALGGLPVEDRRRSAFKDDVGRLRLCQRFSRRARSCLYARRPDLDRAPASGQTARYVHSMPRLDLRTLQEGR